MNQSYAIRLDGQVERRLVSYPNRYGITLAAHL